MRLQINNGDDAGCAEVEVAAYDDGRVTFQVTGMGLDGAEARDILRFAAGSALRAFSPTKEAWDMFMQSVSYTDDQGRLHLGLESTAASARRNRLDVRLSPEAKAALERGLADARAVISKDAASTGGAPLVIRRGHADAQAASARGSSAGRKAPARACRGRGRGARGSRASG